MNTFVVMSSTLFEYSIVAIFYALYYGVLSRDMIDLMSDIMASNLGVSISLSYTCCLSDCLIVLQSHWIPRKTPETIYLRHLWRKYFSKRFRGRWLWPRGSFKG